MRKLDLLMDTKARQRMLVLALLAAVSALSTPGIFLAPIYSLQTANYFVSGVVITLALDALRIFFVASPLVGLLGALRSKAWAPYALTPFPFAAWTFGASAVPFISWLFPIGVPRTIAITIINLAFLIALVWIARSRSEKLFKPNPLREAA